MWKNIPVSSWPVYPPTRLNIKSEENCMKLLVVDTNKISGQNSMVLAADYHICSATTNHHHVWSTNTLPFCMWLQEMVNLIPNAHGTQPIKPELIKSTWSGGQYQTIWRRPARMCSTFCKWGSSNKEKQQWKLSRHTVPLPRGCNFQKKKSHSSGILPLAGIWADSGARSDKLDARHTQRAGRD